MRLGVTFQSDANASVAGHEIAEAIADPLVSTRPYGWYDSGNGGTVDRESGLAHRMRNGHFHDLQ